MQTDEQMTRPVVLASGTVADICAFLHCSRTTLWRRMKENPENFRKFRTRIVLIDNQPINH